MNSPLATRAVLVICTSIGTEISRVTPCMVSRPTTVARRPAASTRRLWKTTVGKRSTSKKSELRRCLSRISMPVSSDGASMVRLMRPLVRTVGSTITSPLKREKRPSAFINREVARNVISLASGWMRKRSDCASAARGATSAAQMTTATVSAVMVHPVRDGRGTGPSIAHPSRRATAQIRPRRERGGVGSRQIMLAAGIAVGLIVSVVAIVMALVALSAARARRSADSEERVAALEERVRGLVYRVWRLEGGPHAETPRESPPAPDPAAYAEIAPAPPPGPPPVELAPPLEAPAPDAPVWSAPGSVTPAPPRRGLDLEQRIGARWATWVGIVAILVGVALFLKWAFDSALLGPAPRVALGLVAGLVMLGGGLLLHRRRDVPYLSEGLAGGGLGVLFLSLFAAHALYGLVGPKSAFVAMFAVTLLGTAVAVVSSRLITAVLAVLGGLLTPVLLQVDRPDERNLLAYLLVLDGLVLFVARFRTWPQLNRLAWLGTVLLLLPVLVREPEAPRPLARLLLLSALFLIFLMVPLFR